MLYVDCRDGQGRSSGRMCYYQFYQPFVISLICCPLLWPFLIEELEGFFSNCMGFFKN